MSKGGSILITLFMLSVKTWSGTPMCWKACIIPFLHGIGKELHISLAAVMTDHSEAGNSVTLRLPKNTHSGCHLTRTSLYRSGYRWQTAQQCCAIRPKQLLSSTVLLRRVTFVTVRDLPDNNSVRLSEDPPSAYGTSGVLGGFCEESVVREPLKGHWFCTEKKLEICKISSFLTLYKSAEDGTWTHT